MSEKDQDRVGREDSREEVPGRRKVQDGEGDQNKRGVDKLIDKAQEKGVFDKATKTLKDRFGGGGKKR